MGSWRIILDRDIEAIDGRKLLVINDVYGSHIITIYRGQKIFLAIEKNGHILSI